MPPNPAPRRKESLPSGAGHLLSLLLLLSPGAVLAQAGARDAPSPTPPPLVAIPEEATPPVTSGETPAAPLHASATVGAPVPAPALPELARTRDTPKHAGARVLLEAVGGTLCGGAGMLAGVASAVLLQPSLERCSGDVCTSNNVPRVGFTLLGASLGAATGVYLSGTWMDGRGGALPTFAGALVGGAASTGLYAAGMGRDDPSTLFLLALPLAGAITAFEVSSALRPPRPLAARPDGPHLVPTVGVTPDGGTLGLAGRF